MKINKKKIHKIILEELKKILRESGDDLEDFKNRPSNEAIEIIRPMDPSEVVASTVDIFMGHPDAAVRDYVKQKFNYLDSPELLGAKIFLAYPNEGKDEPLTELAQQLRLNIKELPDEEEIENFQKRLNDQKEEYDDDLPTAFLSQGTFGGGGMDPLMIWTKVGRFEESVYYLSPHEGFYIETLVDTYRELLRKYEYPYEPANKIKAVGERIRGLLGQSSPQD